MVSPTVSSAFLIGTKKHGLSYPCCFVFFRQASAEKQMIPGRRGVVPYHVSTIYSLLLAFCRILHPDVSKLILYK